MKLISTIVLMVGLSQIAQAETCRSTLLTAAKSYTTDMNKNYRANIKVDTCGTLSVQLVEYIEVERPTFPARADVVEREVTNLSSPLLQSEFNQIKDTLIYLSGAEMMQINPMICMVLPPSFPEYEALSIRRGYNPGSRSFEDTYMTGIIAKTCYIGLDEVFVDRKNYEVAEEILQLVLHVTDVITADYIRD